MSMKRRALATLALLLVSGLAACTSTTTDPSKENGSPGSTPSPSPRGDDDPAGSPGTANEDDPTPSNVPAELAGTSWTWTTSAGVRRLAFAADGSYESDVFLNGHPGDSCGTEFLTHHAGKVTFEENKFTLRSSLAERTKTDSCTEEVVSKDTIDPFVTTYEWRIDDDGTGREALILVDEEMPDAPSHYYRDGE